MSDSDHAASNEFRDYDHRGHEAAYDPWPRWEKLRAGPPLAYTEMHGGYHVASRYDTVCQLARNAEVFSSYINQTTIPTMAGPRKPPIDFDPPDHHFYRIIVNPFFTPARVKRAESWIRELAVGLVKPLLASDGFDLPRELGHPMTRAVILRVMGIVDAPADVNRWANNMIFADEGRETAEQAAENLSKFLQGECDKRRANPGDDVMTALVQARHNGRALTEEEQVSTAFLLLLAGLDTTSYTLAGAVWYLLQNPEVREELVQANDTTWRLAMDEFFRWVSPSPAEARTARVDADVGGCPVRAGERVMLLFGSANRDPAEFPDPDSVILNRFPNRHVAFGMGPHRCLGSNLAKLVLQIVLKELVPGLGDFKLGNPDEIVWEASSVRGMKNLPLVRT